MRPSRALSLAATVFVSAAAPGALAGEGRPPAGIGDLLDQRAEAMLDGDRERFLATVAPGNADFDRRQGLLFDGYQRLGLREYELAATGRLWHELTTERERSRYRGEVRVLHVEERYALAGYDLHPAVEDLYLTFVGGSEGWKVASDSDLEDLALFSARKLWEMGPIRTRASEHFLFVSHPALASASRRVLRAAERALRRVERGWPLPWHQQVVILAPSTSGELRRLIQASFDLDVFVAFAASGVDRERDWTLAGHRIFLNWPSFSGLQAEVSEDILAHELVHIATRDDSGPLIPIFVEEGVAEWVTGARPGRYISSQVEAGDFDRRLPRDHEFVAGDNSDILTAYDESTAAVTFAAERFGEDRVAELYDRLGEVRRAPGTWRYHLDLAMREAFGVGYGPFEDRWARWAVRTLR